MRSNLAYDYRRYQNQEEEYEEKYEEIKEPEIEPKKRSINGYVMAVVLGAMILVPGAIHVNCIYVKIRFFSDMYFLFKKYFRFLLLRQP